MRYPAGLIAVSTAHRLVIDNELVDEGVGGLLCIRARCDTIMSSDAKETISGVPSVGPHGSFKGV